MNNLELLHEFLGPELFDEFEAEHYSQRDVDGHYWRYTQVTRRLITASFLWAKSCMGDSFWRKKHMEWQKFLRKRGL